VIRFERLARWMDEQGLPGKGEPVEHRFLSGGTQNEIYEIRRGDQRVAIRIPPPAAPADRDEGILREWRILQALDGTDVPHPRAVAACPDASVLGRPFYLMGFVDGWSPMGRSTWPEPFGSGLQQRAGLGLQLAEGIALLSRVDWRARGLQGLGRPENFHERQVDRWTSFFASVRTRDLEGMDVASAWLRAHKPLDYIPGIMHGDYQFANVMFRDGAPAALAAIVDWEMGTVGDPKLDLGWMIQSWPEDTMAPQASQASYVDLRGMPSRSQVLAHYSEVSGRQVDDIDYYVILAKWKLAIVLEKGYARAGDDEKLLAFGPVIVNTMKSAAELAETTDYGR
jgi:aminoglycoside phosphotransferase (APT) family kinase protein